MYVSSADRRLFAPLAPALISCLAAVSLCGCQESHERAASAVSLPALQHDPAELGHSERCWLGWRGAKAAGICSCKKMPVQWNTQEGLRWRQNVPGRGNSSPVICGDNVLLTTSLGEQEGSVLQVCSFDRQTGQPRWQTSVGNAGNATHNKNGYASASVASDGRQVFASLGSAGLFALDLATGQQRWRQDLGSLQHQWGFASSPVLVGKLVIQLCDSASGSEVRAFDKGTGRPVWRTTRTSSGCWSTPVLTEAIDAAGQKHLELIVNGTGVDSSQGGFVIAYDPADGAELWRVQGTTGAVCPTAVVGGDLVVSTSGRNGPIIAIRPGGSGDVTQSHVAWRRSRGGPYVPTGVAYRNRLYTVSDSGVVTCFNLGSGEEVWHDRLKGNFTASLLAGDGRIYAVNEHGVVYVFAAADTFELLAANDMQERILATPAAADGDLFLRTETQLYCVRRQGDDTVATVPAQTD